MFIQIKIYIVHHFYNLNPIFPGIRTLSSSFISSVSISIEMCCSMIIKINASEQFWVITNLNFDLTVVSFENVL